MTRALLCAIAALGLLTACEVNVEQGNDQAQADNAAAPAANEASEADEVSLVAVPRETAAQLIQARQNNYKKIGDAMKLISRGLRSDSPALPVVRTGAATIATLAPQVPGWFPAGTGQDLGKTGARAEIWQRPDDFSAKAEAFEEAARNFELAAQGNDLEAIRAAHADLGKSCKACHDLYREKE